jgi:2-oxoglutarate ferredoxin oxidoreductase subunit gamma
MEINRVVFTGSGGQGVITASIILAEAAVLFEDLNAVQSQSYGPEARGGATRADVILSTSEIFYPKVIQPNTLVCLTQAAYHKYMSILRPGGLLLTDSHFVRTGDELDARHYQAPIYETVMEKLGKPVVFNVCMLGVLIGLQQLIKQDSIMRSLETRVPADFLDLNRQALELGIGLAEKCLAEE